jgi:branched-chain amino acid transport system ATP-binding protein
VTSSKLADPGAAETAPALEVRQVTVNFGGVRALDGVDLTVPASSRVGLVGPNGAGKTTLFQVMSGFLVPNEGSVLLDGRDVTRTSPHARARLGLARTFQHPEVFETITVAEQLTLAYRVHAEPRRMWTDLLSLRGWRRGANDELDRVSAMIELLGLQAFAHREVQGLPMGIARLAEVGSALIAKPRVILLDEPSAGLNSQETGELAAAVAEAADQEDVAVVLVEHDLHFVLAMARLVYVLNFGQLIASGSPAEIRANDTVQDAYLGKASIAAEQGTP